MLSEITLEDEAPAFEESGETLTDDLVFESSDTGADKVNLDDQAGMATEETLQPGHLHRGCRRRDRHDDRADRSQSADLTEEVEEEEIEEIGAPGAQAPVAVVPPSRSVAPAVPPRPGSRPPATRA